MAKTANRFLSALLAFLMIFQLCGFSSVTAFAEDDADTDKGETALVQPEEQPEEGSQEDLDEDEPPLAAADAVAEDSDAPLADGSVEDGFYLVGSMNEWTPDPAYKLTVNPGSTGEYMLVTTLSAGDEFKAVKIEGANKTWYPDGTNNNYVVDADHSGRVTIYFRETYNGDWYGHFYVASAQNAVAKIGNLTFDTLEAALNAAQAGDVVELLQDVDMTSAFSSDSARFAISKSLTIDGDGHTITVAGRGFGVGMNASSNVDVTFKNVTIENSGNGARCIDTRGNIGTLTLDHVVLSTDDAPSGYTQPLTIGGSQSDTATIVITDSEIRTSEDASAYYAIITFNPVNMTIENSTIKGWACIYAKGKAGSAGSAGSVFNITGSNLVSSNKYNGTSNAFAMFTAEDDNVAFYVSDSDITINADSDQDQAIISTNNSGVVCSLQSGNNVQLNGENAVFTLNKGEAVITGGTFNVDPSGYLAEGYKAVKNDDGTYTVTEKTYEARIDETKYETLAEAVAAAQEGETVEVLVPGTYTLLGLPKNITVEGAVDGVVFEHTSVGNIAAIPNGATFRNVTFNLGNNNYHGFQHNGGLTFENCTFNGKFFTYGTETYTNCTFTHSGDYNMWVYGGNNTVTYNGCTFNNTGKYLNVYNESGDPVELIITNCHFINSAGTANKAAINIKETQGTTALHFNVTISGSTLEGPFPSNSIADDLVVGADGLWQVDDRLANIDDSGITVTLDGEVVYPLPKNYVAAIGETKYETLQDAIDAAQDGDTIVLISDVADGAPATVPAGKSITLDLSGKTYAADGSAPAITNNGTLAILDSGENGKIDGGAKSALYNAGTFTMTGGTLYAKAGSMNNATVFNASGEADFNGGKIANPDRKYSFRVTGGTVTLEGETYVDGKVSAYGGDIVITGGYYKDTGYSSVTLPTGYLAEGLFFTKEPVIDVYYGVTDTSEDAVAQIVRDGKTIQYLTLNDAVYYVKDGETIVMIADSTEKKVTKVYNGFNVTIDLNGHSVTKENGDRIFSITHGTLNLIGEGSINATYGEGAESSNFIILLEGSSNAADHDYSVVNIGAGVTLNGEHTCGVCVLGSNYGTVVNLDGKINAYVGVSTNGQVVETPDNHALINLNSGSEINAANIGVYQPTAYTEMTVNGKVTGSTGIVVKGGIVTVNEGAEINGTGEKKTAAPVSSGGTDTGDALYVEDTYNNINSKTYLAQVYVNGGNLKSTNGYALQYYTNKTDDSIAVGFIQVNGGDFSSAGEQDEKNSSELANKIVLNAGVYDHKPLQADIAEGKFAVLREDGRYEIGDPVAKIGDNFYSTLELAFAAAVDGDTIVVLKDCAGNGIKVPEGKFATGLTVDFDGHSYDFSGKGVGSNGTEYNGFQLLKDNNITFKNGTLTASSEDAGFLIQNYSNLSLENMTVDGSHVWGGYAMSNNNGTVQIKRSTITAPEGGVAFDVCRYASYPSVHVTVEDSTINGIIEVSASGNDPKEGAALTLKGKTTVNGSLRLDGDLSAPIEAQDILIVRDNSIVLEAPADYKWIDNGNDTVRLTPKHYVAQIGETKYETLAEAAAAAQNGDTIVMIADSTETDTADFTAQNVTLDLNGKTVTRASDCIIGVEANASLTIAATNGGAVEVNGGYYNIGVEEGGTLIVQEGTIKTKGTFGIVVNGTMIMNGGSLEAQTTRQCAAVYPYGENAEFTMNGGSIRADGPNAVGVLASSSAKVFITDGSVSASGNESAAVAIGSRPSDSAEVTITGGTISAEGDAYNAAIHNYGTGTIKISGANTLVQAQGADSDALLANNGEIFVSSGIIAGAIEKNNGTFVISGGWFVEEVPEAYCAEGVIPDKNAHDDAPDPRAKYTVKTGEYVAQITRDGVTTKYETLEDAFAAAVDGDTIVVLKDCAGNGIKVPQGKFATNGLTVDFAGHTYTVDGSTVGSTGTETNGFQLLKDNKITFKNGTIYSEKAKILIQNYSDLTLDGMTLTLNNASYSSAYTLSNNNGEILVKNSTINANTGGGFAFDVCRYASYPSVHVTVEGSTINGKIEIYASGNDPKEGSGLTLKGSTTVSGALVVQSGLETPIENQQILVAKDNSITLEAPADYKWIDNGNDTVRLTPKHYVAQIGETKYETLTEAVAAAPTDGTAVTILMIDDSTEANASIDVTGKSFTLDLNGHVVTLTAGDGFTGSNANITFKDSTDTEANGTGTGKLLHTGNYEIADVSNSTINVESGLLESSGRFGSFYLTNSTVNISGGKLNGTGCSYVMTMFGSELNLTGGEIESVKSGLQVYNGSNVTISDGSIHVDGSYAIMMQRRDNSNSVCTLTMTGGTVHAGGTGIGTNGSHFEANVITISGGTVQSDNYAAIYNPNRDSVVNISGDAVLIGGSGIVAKGGTVNISGGTITATGPMGEPHAATSGYSDTGDAIYIEDTYGKTNDSETPYAPTVNITGGTFISANGHAVQYYTNTDDHELAAGSVTISDGNFIASSGAEAVLIGGANGEPHFDKFISGGWFSNEIPENFCVPGVIPDKNAHDDAPDSRAQYTVKTGEYVAQITRDGVTTKYETLEEAFAAAVDGDTIVVLASSAGNGIKVPEGKFTTGLTVDFDGHSYDFSGKGVGSKGTEYNGFQLLKDNNITFQNGTLTASSEDAGFLIQNYSNLSLENMTVDGSNVWGGYAMSNNNGTIQIKGTTITAPEGGVAFDVCRYSSYPTVSVTVEDSTINGNIEISASSNDPKDGSALTLKGATTVSGALVIDGDLSTPIEEQKILVVKDNSITLEAPADYKWIDNGNDTVRLTPKHYVAQIGETKYETLAEAAAAAQNGDTIVMIDDSTETARVYINTAVTLDLNGKTVSNTGTVMNVNADFTILDSSAEGNGKIEGTGNNARALQVLGGTTTLKSGALYGKQIAVLTSNGNFVLDGGSVSGGDGLYALSGSLTVNGGTITATGTAISALNDATVTFNNGTVHSDNVGMNVYDNAKATINGGVIAGYWYGVCLFDTAEVVMNDGTIQANGYPVSSNFHSDNGFTFTINGGQILQLDKDQPAIYMPGIGTVNINGGYIEGKYGVKMYHGVLNIAGGTIVGTGDSAVQIINSYWGANDLRSDADRQNFLQIPQVSISGGNMIGGEGHDAVVSETGSKTHQTTGEVYTGEQVLNFISGGWFSNEIPENFCVPGVIPDKNAHDDAPDSRAQYTVKTGEYVAQITRDGVTTKYETLEEAFAAAVDGDTIVVLKDCAGNGIKVPEGKFATGLTVDFDGHSYDFSGKGVGSKGTEYNGFQLLKDNNITFQNGTLTASSEDAGFLIQNYSNLSLENMTVDGSNVWGGYAMSNNNGTVQIKRSTITAPEGGVAFDVCRYASYPTVSVTVEDSTINGNIEISASSNDPKDGSALTLKGATTVNGALVIDGDLSTPIEEQKILVVKDNSITLEAPADYKWIDNGNDTVRLTPKHYVAENTNTGAKYETLEEAIAAAKDGETIKLLKSCSGNGIKAPQGKFAEGLTVDFAGFTYTVDGSTVGSTGTETNGFQLLKDNKITFKNGTISSEKAKILIQNYSNLTLDGMTLELNNANYSSAYTLSNNNGNVVIKDSTIGANPAGGFAFDVCRYSSYPSVHVTVENSTINGNIEVSASGNDPKDGSGLTLKGETTVNGALVIDGDLSDPIEAQKILVVKDNSITLEAPQDYKWIDNGNDTVRLTPKHYVAANTNTGAKYETLAEAIAEATAGDTIRLLKDIEEERNIINKDLTLNLDGNTLTGRLTAKAGKVTVDNGTIVGRVDGYDSVDLTIAADAKIQGQLIVWGDGEKGQDGCKTPTVTVNGTITNSGDAAISTNGTDKSGAKIIIGEGAKITSTDEIAIYLPSGDLTVNGGEITGTTAIYQKSGSLEINSGTITGNGAKASYDFNGNGANATGDAIVVESCGYPNGTPTATVNGGTLKTTNGLQVGYYEKSTDAEFADVYAKDNTLTIPEDYKWVETETEGLYKLTKRHYVAQNVETQKKYETLTEAVNAAADGQTVKLLEDLTGELSEYVIINNDKTFTVDLDGHTANGGISLKKGHVTIDNGRITDVAYGYPLEVTGFKQGEGSNSLTLGENVTVTGDYGLILWNANGSKEGYGSTITVNGKIEGVVFVSGNLQQGDSVINVNSGAKISGDDVGIALNGYATVNVNEGAEVSGTATGIEVRAGELNVSGGTITGNGTTLTVDANGSGTTTKGAGIAVAQHTTKLPIKISITGGTIKGYSAFYESNPQNISDEDLAKIQVSITGGNFYAINGGAEAIHAEDLEGFVSAQMNGEEFVSRPWASSKIDAAYVAEGFVPSDALEHDPAYTIVIERTVTFEPDNGEQATTVKVGDGTAVEKPATDPEKEGYHFLGWYLDDAEYEFETPVTSNITLTAKWEINTYTVTFTWTLEGVDEPVVETYTVEHGQSLNDAGITVPAPTDTNYDFIGFIDLDPDAPITGNMTYVGQWDNKTYLVVYTNNADNGKILESYLVKYGENTPTFQGEMPEREGYDIRLGEEWTPAIEPTVTKPIVYDVNWIKILNVTFVNGDDVTETTVLQGDTLAEPTQPTKEGYTFLGWYAEDSAVAFDFSNPVQTDLVLTAIWQVNTYTITFNSDGGSEVQPISVDYGSTGSAPADPAKNGAVFGGWTLDGQPYDFTEPVTSDLTLKATWVVAENVQTGRQYATLAEAMAEAESGQTVRLLVDRSESLVLSGGKQVTLDLNEKTLTGAIDAYDYDLTLTNGKLAGTFYANGLTGGKTGKLTLAEDAVIESDYAIILWQANDNTGNGYTIDLNGTVNGVVWVMGNIKEGDSVINVNSGAKISGDDVGIALNGYATVNVNEGAEVSGTATGIEVRAGVLNVTGGTITGNGTTLAVAANGSGTTTSGAGIAVAQHTTKLPIEVNITGGTISGYTAFYESNPQNNSEDDLAKVQVSITGGSFVGVDEAIYAEDLTGFVSAEMNGEEFANRPWASNVIPAAYIAEGFLPDYDAHADAPLADAPYTLKQGTVVAENVQTGRLYATLAEAMAEAESGQTVRLLVDRSESLVLSGGKQVTLDLNEKTLTGSIDAYDYDLTLTNGKLAGTFYANGLTGGKTGKLTLAEDAVIESDYAIILWQANDNTGYGYTIDLNGTVNGIVWVMGNITEGDSVINVNSGAKISGDDVGIALNGYATVNVNEGAEVSGTATGIEVRAGVLNVTGGTITGNSGTATAVTPSGSGTTTSGAGIAVAQHTTKLPIEVNITGGTISGYTAFYESNPQNNSEDDLAKVQVSITGGSFVGVDEAIHADDLTGFVSAEMNGEEFVNRPWASSKIDEAYVAEDFAPSDEQEHDPAYTVVIERTVSFEPDNGEEGTTIKVPDGGKVAKPDPDPTKEGCTFKFWSADGENEFDFENTCIKEDLTLTAVWEAKEYRVTVTSAGGSLDGPTVATVQGGGILHFGESTTLIAPEVDGYTFAGWYRDGELVSAEMTYTFTLESASSDTIAFIALYQPMEAGLFRLEITGSKFRVSNLNAVQRSYFDDWYTVDTQVTVTFVGSSDEVFLYWVNGNGKIVSTSPEYTFYMVNHTELHAVYSDADTEVSEALVVFVNSRTNGQVLASHYYTSDETIAFPSAPSNMGREFIGWSLTEDQIKEKMATQSKVVVYAKYQATSEYYVYVANNLNDDVVASDPIHSGNEYVVEADTSLGTFCYWEMDGKIVSYTPSLLVRSNDKDIELTAVYDVEGFEAEPVITMTDCFGAPVDGKYGLSFVAMRSVPEGWTVERQGILYTTRTDLADKDLKEVIVLNGDGIRKYDSNNKDLNGVLVFTAKATKAVTVHARGYMIVMKDGVSMTVYSDEILELSYEP